MLKLHKFEANSCIGIASITSFCYTALGQSGNDSSAFFFATENQSYTSCSYLVIICDRFIWNSIKVCYATFCDVFCRSFKVLLIMYNLSALCNSTMFNLTPLAAILLAIILTHLYLYLLRCSLICFRHIIFRLLVRGPTHYLSQHLNLSKWKKPNQV